MKSTTLVLLAFIVKLASSASLKRTRSKDELIPHITNKIHRFENWKLSPLFADECEWISLLSQSRDNLQTYVDGICSDRQFTLKLAKNKTEIVYPGILDKTGETEDRFRPAPLLLLPSKSVVFPWDHFESFQDLESFYPDVELLVSMLVEKLPSQSLTGHIYTIYNNLKQIPNFDYTRVLSLANIHHLATLLEVDGGQYLDSLKQMNMPIWMKSLIVILRFEFEDPTARNVVFWGNIDWMEQLIQFGIDYDIEYLRSLLVPFFVLKLGDSNLAFLNAHADNLFTAAPLNFYHVSGIAASFSSNVKTVFLFNYCNIVETLKGEIDMIQLQEVDVNGVSLIGKFPSRAVEMLLSNRVNCRYISPHVFTNYNGLSIYISPKCFNLLPNIENISWHSFIDFLPKDVLSQYTGKISPLNCSQLSSKKVSFLNPSLVDKADFDLTSFNKDVVSYLPPSVVQRIIQKHNIEITNDEWKLLFTRGIHLMESSCSFPSIEYEAFMHKILSVFQEKVVGFSDHVQLPPKRRLVF